MSQRSSEENLNHFRLNQSWRSQLRGSVNLQARQRFKSCQERRSTKSKTTSSGTSTRVCFQLPKDWRISAGFLNTIATRLTMLRESCNRNENSLVRETVKTSVVAFYSKKMTETATTEVWVPWNLRHLTDKKYHLALIKGGWMLNLVRKPLVKLIL